MRILTGPPGAQTIRARPGALSPSPRTARPGSSVVEHSFRKAGVDGSNPSRGSICATGILASLRTASERRRDAPATSAASQLRPRRLVVQGAAPPTHSTGTRDSVAPPRSSATPWLRYGDQVSSALRADRRHAPRGHSLRSRSSRQAANRLETRLQGGLQPPPFAPDWDTRLRRVSKIGCYPRAGWERRCVMRLVGGGQASFTTRGDRARRTFGALVGPSPARIASPTRAPLRTRSIQCMRFRGG